jgi:ribosomal protein S1
MSGISEGDRIQGTVVHVTAFGLFVEIRAPALMDALLSFDRTPCPEIARLFRVGDKVEVVVTEVNVDKETVRVELLPDPTIYEGFWAVKRE